MIVELHTRRPVTDPMRLEAMREAQAAELAARDAKLQKSYADLRALLSKYHGREPLPPAA